MSLPVDDRELLARFIFDQDSIRRDNTVKPDALMPFKYTQLSVTRHVGLTEQGVWQVGCGIERLGRPGRTLKLMGRVDILAAHARSQGLSVNPDEPPPNHAHIEMWPAEKDKQKIIAIELAALNNLFIPKPAQIDCSGMENSSDESHNLPDAGLRPRDTQV